jgi:phosphatidylinositol alpha 1,6-mannosyltransferase
MAAGLPAIAPRSGGPVDLIQDGHNGFLCAPHDQAEWGALIRRCVETPALFWQLGHNARVFAESRSWEAVFNGLLADYAALLKAKAPAKAATPVFLPAPPPTELRPRL